MVGMVEERDIACIGIPFVAGAAIGLLAMSGAHLAEQHLIVSFSLITLLSLVAAAFSERIWKSVSPLVFFAAVFLIAGIFSALSFSLTAGIRDGGSWAFQHIPETAVGKLKDLISSIPYPSETTAPLLKALLTGDRSDLPKEVTAVFRQSGASHILALSGLHLGVIYMILTRMLMPLGNTPAARKARFVSTVGFSLFYCLMTGAGASIVRAFLFILLNETARITGRERRPACILLSALTIQVALKPEVLTTLGFQLSYLAMAGIFFLYPAIERIYPAAESKSLWGRIDPMRRIWKGATMSISCQVFTAPLVWFKFHTFPEYFLITNLIALPLTSAIMILSVLTVALSAFGLCPMFIVTLNDQAVQALIFCLRVIAGSPDGSW